jgi:hypothetical protein
MNEYYKLYFPKETNADSLMYIYIYTSTTNINHYMYVIYIIVINIHIHIHFILVKLLFMVFPRAVAFMMLLFHI